MIGVDEVGRGAWAGPLLVVAARLKEKRSLPEGLTDSKLLTDKQKQTFYDQVLIDCDFGEGWVSVAEIDEIGLGPALRLGAARAMSDLGEVVNEEIVIDGKVNLLQGHYGNVTTIVGADISVPIVSAASVYAKVIRDKYMRKLHFTHPGYGFKDHVGYGTQKHIAAIKENGVSEHHRKSFKPIIRLL